MGLTGRYDFKGIQKAGRALINSIVIGTSWGAALLASPFKPAWDVFLDFILNYFANRGLIVFNVTAVIVDGKIDEAKLTSSLNSAFERLKIGRDKITPEEGAKIDAEVTEAFDQFADVPMADGVSDVPGKTL